MAQRDKPGGGGDDDDADAPGRTEWATAATTPWRPASGACLWKPSRPQPRAETSASCGAAQCWQAGQGRGEGESEEQSRAWGLKRSGRRGTHHFWLCAWRCGTRVVAAWRERSRRRVRPPPSLHRSMCQASLSGLVARSECLYQLYPAAATAATAAVLLLWW